MLLERKDEQTARCPFCHDGLEDSPLVECDSCRAVYHDECVERCVVLACQGALARTDGTRDATPRRPVLRVEVEGRAAPAPVRPARAPTLCRAAFWVTFVGFVGLLAAGSLTDTPQLGALALLCFMACVAFAQAETGPLDPERVKEQAREREERRRQRDVAARARRALTPVEPAAPAPVDPGSPLPPPPPVAFPSMFGAPPTPAAGGAADDEARRRIAARRDARRPGGLGKTL